MYFIRYITNRISLNYGFLSQQDIASELKAKKSTVTQAEQNLRTAKGSCDTMVTKLQEHCPDIERQEAEVQKLSKRYDNLNRQIDTR